VNRINKNVDLLKKLDTVKLISPRDITIASIPLIIQRALILGPKFIYDNSLSTNKIVSQLRNNRAVKLNSEQFRHLTNDLNNAPPSKKPQAINTKDLKTVMKRWLDDNNLIIQNADKNLCLALIDKDIYQQHLDALISNTDLYIPISEADAKQFLKEFEAAIHELYFNFHKERRYKSHIAKHTSLASPTCTSSPRFTSPNSQCALS
jgi:urease accessory protein UreE